MEFGYGFPDQPRFREGWLLGRGTGDEGRHLARQEFELEEGNEIFKNKHRNDMRAEDAVFFHASAGVSVARKSGVGESHAGAPWHDGSSHVNRMW